MGGGDLNSKKSWHPNTMKNQERVWKAEQAAAEEKKRMLELQQEHAKERDRAELNNIMSKHNNTSKDDRLSWMYDKPDKKVEQEAYLLGKTLEKNAEQTDNVESDPIPAVSRRVVGSSMLTASGDTQVDMSRKLREDPLLLIKERERAARAALLNNPLQRRRLAELLRKEQEEKKSKVKPKKKDKDLDSLLASKLSALSGGKGIDIATLLDSNDSSSESDDEKPKKKKKRDKQKSKKKKKKKQSSDSDSDKSEYKNKTNEDQKTNMKISGYKQEKEKDTRKRVSSEDQRRSESPDRKKYRNKDKDTRSNDRDSSSYRDRQYRDSDTHRNKQYRDTKEIKSRHSPRRKSPDARRNNDFDQRVIKRRTVMSEEEKAAKLADMASAGKEREVQRGVRVKQQRAADSVVDRHVSGPRSSHHDARTLPESLESRIHSNRHFIQRDKRHMNENFARR